MPSFLLSVILMLAADKAISPLPPAQPAETTNTVSSDDVECGLRLGQRNTDPRGTNQTTRDWPRFRGPNGTGVTDTQAPVRWSSPDDAAWISKLPGPGASSPIIVGHRVFMTSYSGYGLSRDDPGNINNLTRHLTCLDLSSGEFLWQQNVPATLPEDAYDESGVSSHGYASHTPTADHENVYCYFGKSGLHAFSHRGEPLWRAETGRQSDPPRWGSSSSPILYRDLVITTASAESRSVIAFRKTTGEEIWRYRSDELAGTWGTPIVMQTKPDRTELILLIPGALRSLDPNTGRVLWNQAVPDSGQAYMGAITFRDQIIAFAGPTGGLSVTPTGSTPRINWKAKFPTTYSSPVCIGDKIYNIARGILTVVDATTGERRTQLRLPQFIRRGNARFGSLDYASPISAGNRLYFLNAAGQMYVYYTEESPQLIALNPPLSDEGTFWGTPAVSDGRILFRNSHSLFCIQR